MFFYFVIGGVVLVSIMVYYYLYFAYMPYGIYSDQYDVNKP